MSKKWFDTGYLKSKPAEVDHEKGIIAGVKVCSVGEAKGHGVSLDSEFISTLVAQGSESKQGLKARFGHPNMCSSALGTFVGRFKNFSKGTTTRDDGSTVDCCFADLFLSNSAKETPNGDLHSYILSMAENESDMFGTSIVFTPGKDYRRSPDGEKAYRHCRETFHDFEIWYTREDGSVLSDDEENALSDDLYVECEKLHACDCVDEPAANDGLFSAFAQETVAGQITEFLDLHPQVFQAIEDNPDVMEALAQYGDKFDEFMKRYESYRNEQEPSMSKEEVDTSAEVATTEAEELETAEETEALEEVAEEETAETEETSEAETAEETEEAEPAPEAEAEEAELSEAEPSTIDPEEFARAVDEFGAVVAAEAFKTGGGYDEAQAAHYAALTKENETLKAKLAEKGEGADPAEFGEDQGKKLSMIDVISGKTK